MVSVRLKWLKDGKARQEFLKEVAGAGVLLWWTIMGLWACVYGFMGSWVYGGGVWAHWDWDGVDGYVVMGKLE